MNREIGISNEVLACFSTPCVQLHARVVTREKTVVGGCWAYDIKRARTSERIAR